MKPYIYNLYRPAGNDTALVLGIPKNLQTRRKINAAIMAKNPNIEQVGFVKTTPPYQLVMAGGEFCGNATRSAAFLILKGKVEKISLKVSGTNQLLKAGVDKNGNAWSQIPLPPEKNNLIQKISDYTLVNLEGITQVVVPLQSSLPTKSQLKLRGIKLLRRLNLTKIVPAAGVTFYRQTPKGIRIYPVVWVRDIKTLFCETACGSGTAAMGIINAINASRVVSPLPIIQPTGQTIYVNVTINQSREIDQITITGPIQVLTTNQSITI